MNEFGIENKVPNKSSREVNSWSLLEDYKVGQDTDSEEEMCQGETFIFEKLREEKLGVNTSDSEGEHENSN